MKTSRVTNFTDYQDSLRLQRAHELVSISLLSSCVLSSCVFEVALTGCVTVNRDSKKTLFFLNFTCSKRTCNINKIGQIVIVIVSMANNYCKIIVIKITNESKVSVEIRKTFQETKEEYKWNIR